MKRLTALAVACALAVGGIAAGCGSSDDSSSTTSTAASITKAAFVAKANAICAAGNKVANEAAQQQFGNQQPTQAEIEQFTTSTVVPSTQDQIDQISALGAPAGDEAQVKAIIDTAQADIDKLKSDPSLITSNTFFTDANKLAADYGLTVCGQNG
jgi:hypothetical protein